MKKVLIITEDKCDDSELLYPYFRIIEAGFQPVVATLKAGTVAAKYHFTLESDMLVDKIEAGEYAALMLPGGSAPEKLRQNKFVLDATRAFMKAKKPVAAICHGPQILISAGVLDGVRATCYPGIADDLKNAGAKYEDAQVVVDKNLVTSRRPQDLPYFMREFIALIK